MTYDVMLTFDLNSADDSKREEVDNALKELKFKKIGKSLMVILLKMNRLVLMTKNIN